MSAVADTGRQAQINTAFVTLADTLVDEYDTLDLLDRLVGFCTELLAAEAAGIVLGDARRELRAVAASDDAAHVMELLQLQSDEGPCLDCVQSGEPVSVPDLGALAPRWPQFVAAALRQGPYRSVHALPLRLRGSAIGALNLFHRSRVRCRPPTSRWRRRWPTWPRSASCRSGRCGGRRCSPSSCSPR